MAIDLPKLNQLLSEMETAKQQHKDALNKLQTARNAVADAESEMYHAQSAKDSAALAVINHVGVNWHELRKTYGV